MSQIKKLGASVWFSPAVVAIFFLSFSSGLPLLLVGSTLQAWYTVAGVNLMTIGLLTLVGQPYVYKFIWAPLMDRYKPLMRDRRRGWIALTQILLVLGLIMMASLTPQAHPMGLALVALFVAFFSASQDIAIDAYRVDILTVKNRGIGVAMTSLGGRLAVLVAGAFALILAAKIGWRLTYYIMALIIFSQLLVTRAAPAVLEQTQRPQQSLLKSLAAPLRNIFSREHAIAIIIFIIIYKICDAFAFALNTTFLIRGLGFSLEAVGVIYKVVSLAALLAGSMLGGIFLQRLGIYRSLLYFGILQAVANLAYMVLAMAGKNYAVMVLAVFAEYFCSGLATVAFIAFLLSLCDHRYSATQFAVFSALTAIGRVFAGPEVAVLVDHLGWAAFYFVTFLMGIPPIVLLFWLKTRIKFDWQVSPLTLETQ